MSKYSRDLSTVEMTTIMSMHTVIEDIQKIVAKNIPENERQILDSIKRKLISYMDMVGKRIDDDSKDRLASKCDNYVVKLDAKNSSKHQRISVIEDDFYDLTCVTLEAKCKNCDGKYKKCAVRDAFHQAFVPELNLPEENRPCGYMYTEQDIA